MLQANYHKSSNDSDNIFIYEDAEGGLNLEEIKNTLSRKFLFIVGCTFTLTSIVAIKILTTPPVYEASFEILSEPFNIETQITSSNFNNQSAKTREEITSIELDEVQLKILEGPQIIGQIVQSLDDKYPDINYKDLTRKISIEIIDTESEQKVILVKYNHNDEQRVVDVINNLAQTYVQYSLKKRQSRVRKGIAFLDLQIPKLALQVKNIEDQIKKLSSKYNFINADIYTQQLTNHLNDLRQERKQTETELYEARLVLSNLQQELKTQAYNSTTAIDLATPRYLVLLNKLQDIDFEIKHKSVIFSAKSIEIQTLEQERQKIVSLIVSERKSIYQKLNNKIAILKNRQRNTEIEIVELQSQLQEWSAIYPNYNRLQEELTTAKKQLNEFTLQKDALLIDIAQQEAPWQLLSPATEPAINNAGTINYLILGSTLGLLIGVGTALLWGSFKSILYTSAQVEEITKLPILGEIPYASKQKKFKLKAKQLESHNSQLQKSNQIFSEIPFLPQEAFCSFAANLGISYSDNNLEVANSVANIKSFVITSAIPGEGKSTMAFNIARAYATLGKKVLLVDTDLRSTNCLTKNLGLKSEIGLINILSQNNSDLEVLQYIQQLSLDENLFILTSGFETLSQDSTISEPSRLLASEKMHHLMNEVQSHFDLVIYDLCAIIGFPDVNLLAAKTDGIVMVTGLGKIQTTELIEAQKQLQLSKASILGIAVNKIVIAN